MGMQNSLLTDSGKGCSTAVAQSFESGVAMPSIPLADFIKRQGDLLPQSGKILTNFLPTNVQGGDCLPSIDWQCNGRKLATFDKC